MSASTKFDDLDPDDYCFVCDKPCVGESFTENALVFSTAGNYGSTLFDPLDSDYLLHIFLCDECITKKPERVWGTGKKLLTEALAENLLDK